MRSKLVSLLAVIGAAVVLVLAANTVALATTGKALIAGKSNTSSKVTTIKRTKAGSALALTTKTSADVPLVVNGKGKVTNLNADTLDGKDSTQIGTRALVWTYNGTSSASRTFDLNNIPSGNYLFSYEVFLGSPTTANGTVADCYFRTTPPSGSSKYGGEAKATQDSAYQNAISGTALLNVNGQGETVLVCRTSGAGTWSSTAGQPVRITAIPIATVTNMGTPGLSGKKVAR